MELAHQTKSISPSPMVKRVLAYVIENFAEELSLDDLANAARLSKFNFCRRFAKEAGTTPMRWVWIFRVLLAAEFIKLDPRWSLTDVAFSCGFASSAHFSRLFKQVMGIAPSTLRHEQQSLSSRPRVTSNSFEDLFVANNAMTNTAACKALSFQRIYTDHV